MSECANTYKRIVIKVGSSLFYKSGSFDKEIFERITSQLVRLLEDGIEIIIVSSGAIAMGMDIMKLKDRPKELKFLQAAAALGQNALMSMYDEYLRKKGCHAAQILLTWEDFSDRKRYLNAKNTLDALLDRKKFGGAIVPIINENDTVSTDEIKFGDNDQLSARVAGLSSADLLVILSDVDGLLDRNKNVISVVDNITAQIRALACPTDKSKSVGGMVTKIEAAKIAVDSGISCVIANGRTKDIIVSVTQDPTRFGTLFVPKKCLDERQRWIAFGTKPKGKIIIDEGARKALLSHKSLLAVGVTEVSGNFECNEIVSVVDNRYNELARGKVGFSSRKLAEIKGSRNEKEVIHRDNLVMLERSGDA